MYADMGTRTRLVPNDWEESAVLPGPDEAQELLPGGGGGGGGGGGEGGDSAVSPRR